MGWVKAIQGLTRSGMRVVAIFIDSASFGAKGSSANVLAGLAESGAVVRTVRYGESINAALEAI